MRSIVFFLTCIWISVLCGEHLYAQTSARFYPVPVIGMSPTEGNTFGVMTVFMINQGPRAEHVFAPSFAHNKTIQNTATFRWFQYPTEFKSILFEPSYSSNFNRNFKLVYRETPPDQGEQTVELELRAKQDIFPRFFGVGPESKFSEETGYSFIGGHVSGRYGYNIFDNFNIGAKVGVRRAFLKDNVPDGLTTLREKFGSVYGFNGSSYGNIGVGARVDTRPRGVNSREGFYTSFSSDLFAGLSGEDAFHRFEWETIGLIPFSERSYTAIRTYWSYTRTNNGKGDVPFYYLSQLGGDNKLRGFVNNRFVDYNSWTVDLEQRFTLTRMKTFGTLVEYMAVPFINIGQVYNTPSEIVTYPRVGAGAGLRIFIPPGLVGRLDAALAGEGLKIYLELGHPF